MSTSSTSLYPLVMKPHFSVRPWGGQGLATSLGKDIPAGEPIGESWELSDHPNGRSTIANGALAGREFGSVLREFPKAMMNRTDVPERYPLLVKFICADEDLSIQVHPDDAYAEKLGDRGKTECWYVMDARPGTEIIYGLEENVTRDQLAEGSRSGEIENQVARHPVATDDFLFVRAGTVHAICGGTLICEIQQSSDTTFRLWDWNRKPARELHIDQSLDVINWESGRLEPDHVPAPGKLTGIRELVDIEFFRVRATDVAPGETAEICGGDIVGNGVILNILGGEGKIVSPEGAATAFESVPIGLGSTIYIPAVLGDQFLIRNSGDQTMRVLISESRE